MTMSELADASREQGNADERLLEYALYANQFDHLHQYNPAYHQLMDHLASCLPVFGLGTRPTICDLGAGTGNFIVQLYQHLEEARFVHVDKDPEMNRIASRKYSHFGIENVEFIEGFIQQAKFGAGRFDLILCVNSLNTTPPQDKTIEMMYSWLKPGGWLYLVDFGRKQNVYDWVIYCAMNAVRMDGVREMLRYARGCTEAFKQNRNARKDQRAGDMWVHSMSELEALVRNSGFVVEYSSECYRGYSDMVIAQREPIIVRETTYRNEQSGDRTNVELALPT